MARAIEERLANTFRYVELDPSNRLTFSYEYSSILRDAGSVFDSAMRRLLLGVHFPLTKNRKEYDFGDYREFLREHVIDDPLRFAFEVRIQYVVVEISSDLERRFLMPFCPLDDNANRKLDWWDAYTGVKHHDIDRMTDGNLGNCLNSVAALAVLLVLMSLANGEKIKLFSEVGLFRPLVEIKSSLFTVDPSLT